MRKPFYKTGRQTWYCEIDRKQIALAKGEKQATKKAAEDAYHLIMAGREPITDHTPVAVLIDKFLDWTKQNKA